MDIEFIWGWFRIYSPVLDSQDKSLRSQYQYCKSCVSWPSGFLFLFFFLFTVCFVIYGQDYESCSWLFTSLLYLLSSSGTHLWFSSSNYLGLHVMYFCELTSPLLFSLAFLFVYFSSSVYYIWRYGIYRCSTFQIVFELLCA